MLERAIVIGSGAGGLVAARELQKKYMVTIIEEGGPFYPYTSGIGLMEGLKKTGMFFSEKQLKVINPAIRVLKTRPDGIVVIKGVGLGGSTPLSTGCFVRMDDELKRLGLDLDIELNELLNEIPISTQNEKQWRPITRKMFDICNEMDLNPQPLPRMANGLLCRQCGQCMFGCPFGAKWDTRHFLPYANALGAKLVNWCRVEEIKIEDGRAIGVIAKSGWSKKFFPADLVILAAGGLGTPIILKNSGIEMEPSLYINPIQCVAAEIKDSFQVNEVQIPFVVQKEFFQIAPYFDYVSFFFNSRWKYKARNIVSLMVQILDSQEGEVTEKGINKALGKNESNRLKEGISLGMEILKKMGVEEEKIFTGTLTAWTPGGMMALDEKSIKELHLPQLPENVYITDATILPRSLSNFPLFTIMALAKRIAKICLNKII